MELEVGKTYNITLKPVDGVTVKINRALFLGVTYPLANKTTIFNFQGEVTEFGLPAAAFDRVAVVEVVSSETASQHSK